VADGSCRHERRGPPVELVALRKLRTLVDAFSGSSYSCADERARIQDDDAKKLAAGRLAVREPETRHDGIIRPPGRRTIAGMAVAMHCAVGRRAGAAGTAGSAARYRVCTRI
jgi:hypothetical protein